MATDDWGILISEPGTSVTDAQANQLLMNTANPFLKIDTQNPSGFITFDIILITEPAANASTVIYQYKHGYKYVPAIEMLTWVKAPPPGQTFPASMTYFQDNGRIGASGEFSRADFTAIVDSQNVYLVIKKTQDSGDPTLILTGTNLVVTVHVFVESLPNPS